MGIHLFEDTPEVIDENVKRMQRAISLVVQKAAEAFQLSDLQNLKTPWGRTYLGFAQKYGPSVWGVA